MLDGGRARSGREMTGRRISPLWRKAPLVLLRYPGLFAALAVGALLLVVTAAVYPLFLSASATNLIRSQIADPIVTAYGAGLTYRNGTMPVPSPGDAAAPVDRVTARFQALTDDPNLQPVEASVLGPVIEVGRADRPGVTRSGRLFGGAQARSKVSLVSGGAGGGVWVPDLVADALDIRPGDTIVLTSGPGREIRLPVTGVFRSLYSSTPAGYWHGWYDDLVTYCPDCAPPPQPLLVSWSLLIRSFGALGIDHAAFSWTAPTRPGLTLGEARSVVALGGSVSRRIADPHTPDGRLFRRCFTGFCSPGLHNGPNFSSGMGDVVSNVERRLTAIDAPARLLRVAGLAVALVVVAAAGAFSMFARRTEATLLDARGFGPVAAGVRAGLEALVPCLAGGLAGLGLALWFVSLLGAGRVDPSARLRAFVGGGAAAAGAVALIGVVSAFVFVYQPRRHQREHRALLLVPWEIAVAALSLWILTRLRSTGAFHTDPTTHLETPSPLLLAFPLVFIGSFAALAARALGAAFRWLRSHGGRLSPARYLAAHRLSNAPGLTLLLVGASGLCFGMFVQSQSIVRSIEATVHAKAEVFVGSDVQALIDYHNTMPERFPMPLTRVTKRSQAGTLAPGAHWFDLLAIDARTFTAAAYWNPAFADRPLQDLVGPLSQTRSSPLPIVLVGTGAPQPTTITINQATIPVAVIGRADSFPGVSSGRPMVVADRRALLEALGGAPNPLEGAGSETQLWIRGDPRPAIAALATNLPYQPGFVITAEEVEDIPYIAATVATFRAMEALGLAAVLLVIVAMLMYLQARQRSQVVSYGLSLRMGMSSPAHGRALVWELFAMLGPALAAGVALAFVTARLLVPLLDPLASIPPSPILLFPAVVVVAAVPAVLAIAVAGGWLTELRARRTDLGQVMRLAE